MNSISDEEALFLQQHLSNAIHRVVFCLAVSFIGVSVTVFIVHGTPWSELNEAQTRELKKLLFLYIACLLSYFLLQGSDPGYVGNQKVDIESGDIRDTMIDDEQDHTVIQPLVQEETKSRKKGISSPPSDKSPTVDENGLDFCSYCEHWKPIRTHHCRACNRCVATFDHHCHFMQTCIGERNHCRFFCFLCVHGYGLWYSWWISFYAAFYSPLFGIGLLVIITGFFLFVISLIGFHSWLIMTSTTSFEMARSSRISYLNNIGDCDLPFSRCLCLDVFDFCCMRDTVVLWAHECVVMAWRKVFCCRKSTTITTGFLWKPKKWPRPGPIIRDSDNICAHPWQNKYYSCC